jgi:hypothetical protein
MRPHCGTRLGDVGLDDEHDHASDEPKTWSLRWVARWSNCLAISLSPFSLSPFPFEDKLRSEGNEANS